MTGSKRRSEGLAEQGRGCQRSATRKDLTQGVGGDILPSEGECGIGEEKIKTV